MKIKLGSIAAVAAALFAGSVFAADLPLRKAPPTWNGLYVGLNIGGGWRNNNNNTGDFVFVPLGPLVPPFGVFAFPFLSLNNNNNNSGGGGGGQVGYLQANVVRAGLNWHFNRAPAPTVACS